MLWFSFYFNVHPICLDFISYRANFVTLWEMLTQWLKLEV
jgi:hypothetical protein